MSRPLAPVLRTGFPFPIRTSAEDGLPFEKWDGVTVATDIIVKREWWCARGYYVFNGPSKSSGQKITVYGDNSIFCIKMTLAQVVEFYWRAKVVEMDFDSLPANITASANANGSGVEFHNPPDDPDVSSSASASVSGLAFTSANATKITVNRNKGAKKFWVTPDGSKVMQPLDIQSGTPVLEANVINLDENELVKRFPECLVTHIPTPYDTPPAPPYTEGMDGSCGASASGIKGDEESGASANTTINAEFYIAEHQVFGDSYKQGFLPGAHNLIQVGPNEFWYAPLMGVDSVVFQIEAFSSYGFNYRGVVADGEEDRLSTGGETDTYFYAYFLDGWSANDPTSRAPDGTTRSPSGCFPINLKLGGDVTLSGTAFGFWCQWDDITSPDGQHGAPPGGSASNNIGFQKSPTVNITLKEWFGWDGLWNETTGAYTA